jgi:adenine C2-methylase RlmN of 23S rRNA A2503 and tRNA A37
VNRHKVHLGVLQGEPLANLDAVVRACTTLGSTMGLGLGKNKVTVSTVGA